MTTITDMLYVSGGVPTMGVSGAPLFTGNWYFVNPATGSDGNVGSASFPFATIYQAYNMMVDGNNDVCVLVGDGTTAGTARFSKAAAQTINSAATNGTITWAKNACHLIGMTAPTGIGNRARIAPPTGTYLASTFGTVTVNSTSYTTFVVVTGGGNYFANFSMFQGFSTGASSNQVCWIDASGGRNYYNSIHFGGMADAASAGSTTGANLVLIGTGGENKFVNCVFGVDTVARTAANTHIIPLLGTTRNAFEDCKFISLLTGSGAGGTVMTSASAGFDRWVEFKNCSIINAVKSTGLAMTQAFSLTTPDGLVLLSNCTAAGVTAWETSTSGYCYVTGAVPTFATSGIGKAS